MDRGAWWAAVHGVARSRTWLSDFTFTFHFDALEKEMATQENPRDGGAWWAAVYGVSQSQTRLKQLSSSSQGYGFSSGHVWMWEFVGSQREELCPWQRPWGRKLGIRKGMIKPQETPCSRASTPKTRVLYGELSPITISLGEGVNLQLQVNKNSWAWQECFSLRTLKFLWPAWSGSSGRMWLFTASQLWEARDVLKLSKNRLFWEVRRSLA